MGRTQMLGLVAALLITALAGSGAVAQQRTTSEHSSTSERLTVTMPPEKIGSIVLNGIMPSPSFFSFSGRAFDCPQDVSIHVGNFRGPGPLTVSASVNGGGQQAPQVDGACAPDAILDRIKHELEGR